MNLVQFVNSIDNLLSIQRHFGSVPEGTANWVLEFGSHDPEVQAYFSVDPLSPTAEEDTAEAIRQYYAARGIVVRE